MFWQGLASKIAYSGAGAGKKFYLVSAYGKVGVAKRQFLPS